MFCHVEGAEKFLPVSTAEGNEKSVSNDLERDEAVCIHLKLWECRFFYLNQKISLSIMCLPIYGFRHDYLKCETVALWYVNFVLAVILHD